MHILFVDDDAATTALATRTLQNAGHVVESVTTAEAALAKALNGWFPLVITARDLPGMSGLDLCRSIRRTRFPADVYVMLLSGDTTRDAHVDNLQAGVDDLVPKPLTESNLLAHLSRAERALDYALPRMSVA